MINARQLARLLWVVGMAALLLAVLHFLAVLTLPWGGLGALTVAGIAFLVGFVLDRFRLR